MIWVLLLVYVIASFWYSVYNLGDKKFKSKWHEIFDTLMILPALTIFVIVGLLYKLYEWFAR